MSERSWHNLRKLVKDLLTPSLHLEIRFCATGWFFLYINLCPDYFVLQGDITEIFFLYKSNAKNDDEKFTSMLLSEHLFYVIASLPGHFWATHCRLARICWLIFPQGRQLAILGRQFNFPGIIYPGKSSCLPNIASCLPIGEIG